MILPRIRWVFGAFAPWCVAAGLVISFTATAGQDTAYGSSRADKSGVDTALTAHDLPARRALMMGTMFYDAVADDLVQEARLTIGDPADLTDRPDELVPRAILKRNASLMPEIDRSHRGDPFVGLRPGFDARWRAPAGDKGGRSASLIFDIDDDLPVANFTQAEGDVTGPGPVLAFETVTENDNFSPRRAGASRPFEDGTTPALPRAIGLSSTTPVALDMAPVEIAGVSILVPKTLPGGDGETRAARAPAQPDYASLIRTASAKSEERCLAEAIYFEARSEPEAGQAAVAQVVLNRVGSGLYPSTICGVVYQNRTHYKACQFSFACEGKSLRVTELDSWAVALRIAREVTQGKTYMAHVGPALNYHADYVRPRWASRLKKTDKIGRHIFYKPRAG